jgi:hypothetical protein
MRMKRNENNTREGELSTYYVGSKDLVGDVCAPHGKVEGQTRTIFK